MLIVDVAKLGCFVHGRQIPEQTAQALYAHRLGIEGEGEVGSNREEAAEGEYFWGQKFSEVGESLIPVVIFVVLVLVVNGSVSPRNTNVCDAADREEVLDTKRRSELRKKSE